ncbi:MAG: hemerythrin domain-containing protein [Alphaproteobacteria bacterium]|nr:hemerythrin domain-containing protein [Alphaproteobacteria bacterium]
MAEPVAHLLRCHQQIRRFSALLQLLAAEGGPRSPEARQAARGCARYLRESLPLHAEDEELSLSPRLATLRLGDTARAALARMMEQHDALEAALPPLLTSLDAFAEDGPVPALLLRERVVAVVPPLLTHIEAEEEVIFPVVDGLSDPVRRQIVQEMIARRQRRFLTAEGGRLSNLPGGSTPVRWASVEVSARRPTRGGANGGLG